MKKLSALAVFCALGWVALAIPLAAGPETEEGWRLLLEARGLMRKEKYADAIAALQKSASLALNAEQKLVAALALTNIGEIYLLQGSRPEALLYYEKALALYRQLGSENGVAIVQKKIALISSEASEAETIPPEVRERLIEDAIDRVRTRVKGLQEKVE